MLQTVRLTILTAFVLGCPAPSGKPDDPAPSDPASCVSEPEIPYDGIDQDCTGDDLVDVDGDSHNAVAVGGDDCNDEDSAIHPGALDIPYDGIDQDCDNVDLLDVDGDGHASDQHGGDDCADNDPARHPGAEEVWYDGVDQDCDQQCDYDQDGDGAVFPGSPVGDDTPCDWSPGPKVWADQDCDDLDPLVTWVEIYATEPEADEQVVPITAEIQIFVYGQDPAMVVTLLDSAGVAVPGTVSWGGGLVTFTPDAPLGYLQVYEIRVEHSCGSFSSTFTTQDEPVPVDVEGLPGRTYQLDVGEGEWMGDPLLETFLSLAGLYMTPLVDVIGAGTDTLDLRLVSATEGEQDLCLPTVEAIGVDFTSNPFLEASFGTIDLAMGAISIHIEEATISTQFHSDSEALASTIFTGSLDTSPLGALYGLPGPDGFCNYLTASYGYSSCEECPSGLGPYCVVLAIAEIPSPLVALDPVTRSPGDIAADPTCP